jgi:5'-deoxynucleotidase YfbR-like HD superfamily hydrolase
VTFHQAIGGDDMGKLVKYLGSYVGNRPTLLKELAEMGYTHIELPGVHRFLKPGETQREKKDATIREVQVVAQSAVSRVMLQATQDRLVDLLSMRKVANRLVDAQNNDMMELETQSSANSTFTAHCMSVAQVSVAIAKQLDLDENQQADIAVCALTHDLGYSLREDGHATPFERHGSAGVRSLIKRRGFHESHIRRMLATVDHHVQYSKDLSDVPSLFARIIHIAEDYDNMTRFRSGGPHLSPSQALGKMMARSGTEYDPTLLQAMVNTLGKYPPGTPLQLSDGRFGSSVSFVRSPESFEKPLVRIIGIQGDRAVPTDETIDLALGKTVVIRPLDAMGVVYG